MTSKPQYSPELIHRAREARRRGDFQRTILTRTPMDFTYDQVALECGHTHRSMAALADITDQLCNNREDCERCIDEWMRRESHDAGITSDNK